MAETVRGRSTARNVHKPATKTLDVGIARDFIGSALGRFTPEGITVDASGKIYVTNDYAPSGNKTGSVVTFDADGTPAKPTITAGVHSPRGVAVDASGKIYVLNWFSNTVTTYTSNGTQTTPTILTGQSGIHGIAVH